MSGSGVSHGNVISDGGVCDMGCAEMRVEKEAKNKCKHKCHGNGLCMETTCQCAPSSWFYVSRSVSALYSDVTLRCCVFGRWRL